MTQLLVNFLTTVLLALGFGGWSTGGDGPQGPGLPASRVGTQVVGWDEGRFPDLRGNPELGPGPRLITTVAERAELLESEPLGPDLAAVAAVDLTTSVIVVAGYSSCRERGDVWGDGATVWFDTQRPVGSETTLCAWSPFTIDIFEVPRSAFATEVALVTPPWDR